MRINPSLTVLTVTVLLTGSGWCQSTSTSKPETSKSSASSLWSFSITADGYVVPHSEFFVSLTITADRNGNFFCSWPQLTRSPLDWLHLGLVAQRTKA